MDKRFATTNWSLVLAAGGSDSSRARRALEALCEAYWYPLYAFVRRQGCSPEDAADLTQGYFVELLQKGFLQKLSPDAGRFRSFLLVSMKHFIANERDRARAIKRGGGRVPFSLDIEAAEGLYRIEPSDTQTPEKLFERRWAQTVLERAMTRLRSEISGTDQIRRFELLKAYLTGEEPAESYRAAAAELGMTESAVAVAVHRMRRHFGRHLRDEIAQTLADPKEIDQEIRWLLGSLSGP